MSTEPNQPPAKVTTPEPKNHNEPLQPMPSGDTWNPLGENVEVRAYTQTTMSAADMPEELPQFQAIEDPVQSETIDDNPSQPSRGQERPAVNPQYVDLSNKEKKQGAQLAADSIIDAYGMMFSGIANFAVKIDKSDLEEKISDGEISSNIQMVIDEEGTKSDVRGFANAYNERVDLIASISPEFREEAGPLLASILEKRGFAMTPEQRLIMLFAQDAGIKGYHFFMLSRDTKKVLANLAEQTRLMKKNMGPVKVPDTPINAQEAPPKETTTQQPKPDPVIYAPERMPREEERPHIDLTNIKTPTTEQPKSAFIPAETAENIPKFGNHAILQHMEEAAKDLNPAKQKKTPAIKSKQSPEEKK